MVWCRVLAVSSDAPMPHGRVERGDSMAVNLDGQTPEERFPV